MKEMAFCCTWCGEFCWYW